MIARVLDLARSFVEGAYQPLEPTSSDKTSVTEETDYPSFCASAVRDDAIFASFRRMSPYVNIVDCCDEESGLACLKSVLRSPEVAGRLDVIRDNDRVGDPVTHDYGAHGAFSPTTLRYAKIARDIGALFGDRRAMDVIEIGVGYGGQCRILEALSPSRSYALVDLPPALDLARKYLTTMGVACAAPVNSGGSGPARGPSAPPPPPRHALRALDPLVPRRRDPRDVPRVRRARAAPRARRREGRARAFGEHRRERERERLRDRRAAPAAELSAARAARPAD